MSETKQQDLTRMLGVWSTRDSGIAIASSIDDSAEFFPIDGIDLSEATYWARDGRLSTRPEEKCLSDLSEQLGDLDDLRRGADVLMQRREYVTAAVVYQLLGDEEGVERAVRLRREEIERERQADEDKPF